MLPTGAVLMSGMLCKGAISVHRYPQKTTKTTKNNKNEDRNRVHNLYEMILF